MPEALDAAKTRPPAGRAGGSQVSRRRSAMSDESKGKKELDPKIEEQITEGLVRAVETMARDGRITCARLRKLSEDRGVPYRVAGAAADSVGIKVHSCELGCF